MSGLAMTRLVVAGAGAIGRRHIAHVAAHPDLTLAAIVDPDPRTAGLADSAWFADLSTCDVPAEGIVIASPTQAHAAVFAQAAARGWHALIEKPLATTLDEIDDMAALARRKGVAILTGHHRRHHPTVAALKELLDGGAVGQPILASALWSVKKPAGYFDIPWRQGADGAPVRMNMSHEIDLLCHLFGGVTEHAALGGNPVRGADRVESGAFVLRFASGMTASVAFADTTPSPFGFEHGTGENPNIAHTGEDYLYITGTKGAIAFPSLRIWSGGDDWSVVPAVTKHPEPEGIPLVRQLEHFADVIAGRSQPINDAASGRRTHELTLAIEAACFGNTANQKGAQDA